MTKRKAALIRQAEVVPFPNTRHYERSMSPSGEFGTRTLLARARVIVLEIPDSADDGCALLRLGENGEVVGDTWHRSIVEAEDQAKYEYGDLLGKWIDVPADIVDEFEFAIRGRNTDP